MAGLCGHRNCTTGAETSSSQALAVAPFLNWLPMPGFVFCWVRKLNGWPGAEGQAGRVENAVGGVGTERSRRGGERAWLATDIYGGG